MTLAEILAADARLAEEARGLDCAFAFVDVQVLCDRLDAYREALEILIKEHGGSVNWGKDGKPYEYCPWCSSESPCPALAEVAAKLGAKS